LQQQPHKFIELHTFKANKAGDEMLLRLTSKFYILHIITHKIHPTPY